MSGVGWVLVAKKRTSLPVRIRIFATSSSCSCGNEPKGTKILPIALVLCIFFQIIELLFSMSRTVSELLP